MNRLERRRQARDDEKRLQRGIDPESTDPEPTAAMARSLHGLIEASMRSHNLDAPMSFLYSKVGATLSGLAGHRVACARGCAHCCRIWVSATAPEILHVAKRVRKAGGDVAERVRIAHRETRDFAFDIRYRHPHPCPMLQDDACSVYAYRPNACRTAVSTDVAACRRVFHLGSDEEIPAPEPFLMSRSIYAIALACALRRVGLPYHAYDFNAGLARALDRDDAERAWLGGEDVFSGVSHEPVDVFWEPTAQQLYRRAFED